MPLKPTSQTKKFRPLTPTEYLLFNDMMARLRALEHVITERYMEGETDREKMAIDLGRKIDRLQPRTPHRLRCGPGYCPSGGVCQVCDFDILLKQLLASLRLRI
jgi:hypothetical protein